MSVCLFLYLALNVAADIDLYLFTNCLGTYCLQCFDAVGWAAGWASGL